MGFSSVVWAPDGMRLGFLHDGVGYVSDAGGGLQELPRLARWSELAWHEGAPVLLSFDQGVVLHIEAVRAEHPRGFCGGWFLSGRRLCRLSPYEELEVFAEAFAALGDRVVFAESGAVRLLGGASLCSDVGAVRELRWLPDGSGVLVRAVDDLFLCNSARDFTMAAPARFEASPDSQCVRYIDTDTGALVEVRPHDGSCADLTPPGLRVRDFAQPARSGELFFSGYEDVPENRQAYRILPHMGISRLTSRPGAHDVFPSDDAESIALLYTDFDGRQSLFRMHGPLFSAVMRD